MRGCKTSKWVVPAFSVAMGLVLLGAGILGHRVGDGLFGLGVMTALGAVFAFGGRSETIRGLRGDGRDERFHAMDARATLASGSVLLSRGAGGLCRFGGQRRQRRAVQLAGRHRRGDVSGQHRLAADPRVVRRSQSGRGRQILK